MSTPPVSISPDETAQAIRQYLRAHPELKHDGREYDPDSLNGTCYVASEAYFHAKGGTDSGLEVYCLSWDEDGTHWFLKRPANDTPDVVIDLSLDSSSQATNIPYHDARHRAFITGYEPSHRCRAVLDGAGLA
jgi:hypothetical protein